MKNRKATYSMIATLIASISFCSLALAHEDQHTKTDDPAKVMTHECKKNDAVVQAKDGADCSAQGGKWEEKKAH